MSVIAKAIADRQSEIKRLQVEIDQGVERSRQDPRDLRPAGEARGSALLLAADGGCGHPGRGDPARRQADEEAPYDVGRREECGVRADDRLLGRAQKESCEVARLRRAGVTAAPAGACGTEAPRRHRDVHPREPPESSGSYRASGGGLQGCPPRGVRPRRWRCGCRARTARRSRRWGRVCESTTTATGRPRGRPPPWRRTGRRRSVRRPRRAGCPLTPRLRREHATANGSGLASPSPGRAASQSPAPFVPSISPYAAVGSLTLPPRETRRRTGRGE